MEITTSEKALISLGKGIQDALLKKIWPEYVDSTDPLDIPFRPCHRCACTHPGWGLTVISLRSVEILSPWELTYYIAHQTSHAISSRSGERFQDILEHVRLYPAVDIAEIGKLSDRAGSGIFI